MAPLITEPVSLRVNCISFVRHTIQKILINFLFVLSKKVTQFGPIKSKASGMAMTSTQNTVIGNMRVYDRIE